MAVSVLRPLASAAALLLVAAGSLPRTIAFVGPVVTPIPSLPSGSSPFTSTARSDKRSTSVQLSPLLTEAASRYQLLLEAWPLPTQCVTSSILAGCGDTIAQVQERKQPSGIRLERLIRFMIKGFGGGVIWAMWFGINERWTNQLLNPFGASTVAKTILSILLEQFIAVPIIYTFWDIPLPTLLSQTQDNRSIPMQIRKTLPGLLWDNAKVWTFANMLVYTVPLQYRVLVSSLVDVIWQSILSSHVMKPVADGVPTTVTGTTSLPQDDFLLETILPRQQHQQLQQQERTPISATILKITNERRPQTA